MEAMVQVLSSGDGLARATQSLQLESRHVAHKIGDKRIARHLQADSRAYSINEAARCLPLFLLLGHGQLPSLPLRHTLHLVGRKIR